MQREYHRWYSHRLGRDMELLIHGHAGAPVLIFPTSLGRFFEYEDRGMVAALGDYLDQGWF
jgi:esterase/lipase superfamily enzyme